MQEHLIKRGYSVDEVIEMYGVSRQTIYNEINNGNVTTFKIGRRRLISKGSLEKWELMLEEKASKRLKRFNEITSVSEKQA